MATAKRLPSGTWRCQAYHYTDSKGKKHYKSFSAKTKKEAEYLAAQFSLNREDNSSANLKVKDCIKKYIDIKKEVLSPATVRGYRSLEGTAYESISNKRILELKSADVQIWISSFSVDRSPKTVKNAYSLLYVAVKMFAPEKMFRVTLPQKERISLYTPSDEDIIRLLNHIKGSELEIAVMLSAFGTLRRGEICALTSDDIRGNTISIHNCMVRDENNQWQLKPPKTYGSYRDVTLPYFVIDRIKNIDGRIINATPDQISGRFKRAIKYTKLPHFRFHDLRHYAASIMHAIGVPDQYIMEMGGWQSDAILKSTYRNVIDLEKKKQEKIVISHFENMSQRL